MAMRGLLAAIGLAAATAAWAQAPDVAWPREVKAADGTAITVYQPQIESWADNKVSARAAVAVIRPGEKDPGYGVIELAARTAIDKSADVATLSELRITKSSFPGASEADAKRYLAALRGAVKRDSWPVSVQALQANLAVTQARSKQKGQPVKNNPPDILFRTTPSLLVLVDGEPVLREAKGAPELKRVINTTSLIVVDPSTSTRYLWALGRWWQLKPAMGSDWEPAVSPPAGLEPVRQALAGQYEPLEGKDADGKPLFDAGTMPRIIIATRPTELLQSKGEPQMSPIPGTQLLYMANSRNDILFDVAGQAYYVLISGRWFSAKTMSGPWSYVPGKSLPADFARIPPDHLMADLLVSVPGTSQAREAAIANQIPQTATVQRDVQPTAAAYDGGEPQWKPIDGTKLSYAPNTAAPVIRVDPKSYYMVQNGVWFTAASAAGPWTVAASVPAAIYGIPPSSPLHYVTYVRVYSSTPTTVIVGYTPGYYGTVMSTDGVVVYGTGYYYPAYVGVYWYPYPPTYGWGWGFTVGMYWGFAMGGGWYTPCCYHGGGGVYVSHHNNINIDNSYNRWGGKSTSITGPGGRNVQATQVGNTTLAKGSGSDNVYAGRDGNVYRRDEGGQWQQYGGRGEGWSDVGGNRPQQLPGDRPQQQPARPQQQPASPQQRPAETRSSLDRQYESRAAGDRAAAQYRQSGGAGFQGGGAYRGGGGGGRRGR
jgi:hypothetical protein